MPRNHLGWAQNQSGLRSANSEACRARLEIAIAADEDDDRTKNLQERHDHFAAQKVAEGDDNIKRGEDLRQEPGQGTQEDTHVQDKAMHGAESFNIGSPARENVEGHHDLEDTPTLVSERSSNPGESAS